MSAPDTSAAQRARMMEPVGKAALIASVGGTRGYADWTNPDTGCGGCWPSSSACPG